MAICLDDDAGQNALHVLGKRKSTELRFAQVEMSAHDPDRFDASDLHDVTCVFCHLVMTDATQRTSCGHVFCGSCIEQWTHPCPVCQDADTATSRVKSIDRTVNSLRARCRMNGCAQVGTLSEIFKHEEECEYRSVQCEVCACIDFFVPIADFFSCQDVFPFLETLRARVCLRGNASALPRSRQCSVCRAKKSARQD